jgi:hypothetical protein
MYGFQAIRNDISRLRCRLKLRGAIVAISAAIQPPKPSPTTVTPSSFISASSH